jgi:hypothetical protein
MWLWRNTRGFGIIQLQQYFELIECIHGLKEEIQELSTPTFGVLYSKINEN